MSQRKVPHTYVIIFFVIVLAAVMTWFIRPGKYVEIETKDFVRMNTVAHADGSVAVDSIFEVSSENKFFYEDEIPAELNVKFNPEPQTWQVFSALFNGFVQQSKIIISPQRKRPIPRQGEHWI